jgi:hypothetical protein
LLFRSCAEAEPAAGVGGEANAADAASEPAPAPVPVTAPANADAIADAYAGDTEAEYGPALPAKGAGWKVTGTEAFDKGRGREPPAVAEVATCFTSSGRAVVGTGSVWRTTGMNFWFSVSHASINASTVCRTQSLVPGNKSHGSQDYYHLTLRNKTNHIRYRLRVAQRMLRPTVKSTCR